MKTIIVAVAVCMVTSLAAGTFIPLTSLEYSDIKDTSISLNWNSMLNLGSCVYEDNLWYSQGIDRKSIGIPQLRIKQRITPKTVLGLQVMTISRDENSAWMLNLNAKYQIDKNEKIEIYINPIVGYSQNRFLSSYNSPEPYWGQSNGKQESRAFTFLFPVIVHFPSSKITCSAKMGYSTLSAEARYNVSDLFEPVQYQDFEYGPWDIFNGGVTANIALEFGLFRVIPEIGLECYQLIEHPDKDFRISPTAGLALSMSM
ncbi:MAG: hypothetical protein PHU99_07230 [Candidatus Cloacimonetes bacterium]|nr:hypothetical protein [Candidatus Cloacimonadota bacterium]MDD3097491.1 hypothetical protein [Candidatus Cloacimonadota bacterium]